MTNRLFIPYFGPDINGLPHDKNHLIFKWVHEKVYFSAAQQGNAMSCHFKSDKKGMKRIHEAIDDFCAFVFKNSECDRRQ